MGKQLDMFPGDAPALPRSGGLNHDLAAAHRSRAGKRQGPARRRDGRSELFCPSCGSRIALDLARELAAR